MSNAPKVATYYRMNQRMTALYVRTARESDTGIDVQIQILQQYAKEHRHDKVATYTDNGFSGLNLNRPAFKNLEADIASGLVQTVIVKDISRISRNHLEFGKWLDDMRSKNVKVISVGDNFDSDTYHIKTSSFEDAIRKYYKESHSQKIKNGIAHAKRRKL